MMRRIQRLVLSTLALSFCLWHESAHASLDLILTQGVSGAQPIAIVPFAGQDNNFQAPDNVAGVIAKDLQNSGRFKVLDSNALPGLPRSEQDLDFPVWKKAGAESIVLGNAQASGDRYGINFKLLDVFKGQQSDDANHLLLSNNFDARSFELRKVGHHIADLIYQKLTGVRGVFSTRIAYVLVQRNGRQARYTLQVADADGYNPKPILVSNEPIMSPAWSHDGKRLAYVTFENHRAQIYVSEIASGARRQITSFSGINGAPAWSPDDQQLAVVLSKDGNPNIYSISLASGQLRQLTRGAGINTEPNWSPDGKSILFTSDRGGLPQIYQLDLATGQQHRVTFTGDYNARASFAADGQSIVFLHRERGSYNIAMQDLQSGTLQILTNSGRDESPSIAPNGSMVLYGNEYGKLGMVSTDGRVKLRLPTDEGDVKEPAWSPFLN